MQAKVYEWLKPRKAENLLIVCEDDGEAAQIGDVVRYLGRETVVLPDFRAVWGEDLRSYREEMQQLLVGLGRLARSGRGCVVIAPLATALKRLPAPDLLGEHTLAFGDRIDLGALKNELVCWGYEPVDIVEQAGEVSFRGDIIDLFAINADEPVRISLFDTDIESIRTFDVATQKSRKEELELIRYIPALFGLSDAQYESLNAAVAASPHETFFKDQRSLGLWHLPATRTLFDHGPAWTVKPMGGLIEEAYTAAPEGLADRFAAILEAIPDPVRVQPLATTKVAELIEHNRGKKAITVIARNESQLRQADLITEGVTVKIFDGVVNLVSPDEIVVSLSARQKAKKAPRVTLMVDDLKGGDFVVHHTYGIGKFEGLRQVAVLGGVRDFLSIAYAGEDKLLLPVENIEMIDRYIADSGSVPVVDRLGKSSFVKLKESVKKRLFEIAGEIVRIAALREIKPGIRINTADPRLAAFRKGAGFVYTPDQERSIAEIFADLAGGRIMDRLLSGDVGFGKTEVAMNAVYAAALSGYQAAVIVPTTLLSSQHYHSFKERLEPLGITVGRIDRFVTAKEKNSVMAQLDAGTMSIVIGTHALLDVTIPKLGLVVIDEEHKFGVKQKEKLKNLKADVHLLSMSATPIPRSLNMALSQIKGYSQITTPPVERQGVRTFVKEYAPKMVKEAITRELRRGGQMFYIHNRIASIEEKKRALHEILPDLRIAVLHSDIGAAETEKILIDFTEGKYDLLLSTSIVESGIHMPRVNTIIIDGADRFGLGDLHQLRGRVGRGRVQGYCYYLVKERDALTPEAVKRLSALESNSSLGSGAVLAFHDLEIRGGGNVVGDAQSGHIKNIGYSLYLRLLEDAICTLSGQVAQEEKEVDIKLAVSAYIAPQIVAEDRLRLELYRRFGRCRSVKEVYEVEEEMIDRFGALDAPTRQYVAVMAIKILALEKGIKTLSSYGINVTFQYDDGRQQTIAAPSKDDDDIIATATKFLRG